MAPSRTSRPDVFEVTPKAEGTTCVFCYGNEAATPPEVFRIPSASSGQAGQEANKPGWSVRVVPNKYPITDIHEVIIHSPDDTKDFEELSEEQVVRILTAYRSRYQVHQHEGHVLIFCNHGESAGASLKHPHSQLVVIPQQITLDILEREPIANIVYENDLFVTYCPDFSQWPYEVWIAPKVGDKNKRFGDSSDEDLVHLAHILCDTLQRLKRIYEKPETQKLHQGEPFTYNFYIYHSSNWYIRIIPRLIRRAGFELGTGLNVNIVDPIVAATELQK